MIPTVKDIAHLPADKLPPLVHVPPVTKPFEITVRPPGSKSLTNRALLLAALADGESVLTGALADADDAQVMIRALRQLGAEIEVSPEVENVGGVMESCGNATIRVKGVAGRWKIPAGQTVTLNLNNAGTATRFLTAAAVLQPPESGGIVIDGNARMRERPIGELVDALREMGVDAAYEAKEGCPPVRVRPCASLANLAGEVELAASHSSQFISGLLLIAAFLPRGLVVHVRKPVTSESYVDLTLGALRCAGVRPGDWPQREGCRSIKIWPVAERYAPPIAAGGALALAALDDRPLPAFTYAVLPDNSAMAFLAIASMIVPDSLVDLGLCQRLEEASAEGDLDVATQPPTEIYRQTTHLQPGDIPPITLARCLYLMGLRSAKSRSSRYALKGPRQIRRVHQALKLIPDETMALAVAASFAGDPSEFSGLKTLRVKETDRLAALQTELARVGVRVEPFPHAGSAGEPDEGIRITPPWSGIDCSASAARVEFDTYDDHRMAMSLALIGLRRPNVYVRDPGCVRKTYPTFWRDLAKVYG